jgi:hypothetical protein
VPDEIAVDITRSARAVVEGRRHISHTLKVLPDRECEQPDQTWHFNPAPGGAGRAPERFEIFFRSQAALELLGVVPKNEPDVKADPEENKDRAIKGGVKTEQAVNKVEDGKADVKTEPATIKAEMAPVKTEPAAIKTEPAPVQTTWTKAMGKRKREDPVTIEDAPAPSRLKREHDDAATHVAHDDNDNDDEIQFVLARPVRRRQILTSDQTVVDRESD